MAKFRYRMQNILDIKLMLESQAKIDYGIAEQEYRTQQQKLQELMVRRMRYEKQLKELMSGVMDIREINHAKSAVDSMKVLVRRQMMEVHRAEKALEKARNELNEIMQDRKMHEKLREKAFAEFQQELRAEEGKAIDGLVSYTYNARK